METDFELILAEYGGRQKVFQRGDAIYSSESGVEGIYYLRSGKIRIDNSRVKSKKEVLVWLLSSGSFFGISSYYNGYNSCAYITTVVSEKAEVILISREEFIHLLKANKEVRNYIINLLYRRLDYIEKRKLYSSRISLKKKVSDSLIFLSPAHCPPESALEGKPYKILIALSELATMINAPRKELVLLIDDLINKKILERDGEGITVRNVEKIDAAGIMSLGAKRIVFFTLVSAYLLYTSFVYTEGTNTENPIAGEAIEGRQLFRDKNCIACHQLYGLGGYMGPDLTNVISTKGEVYVRAFLENGTQKMPDFNLEEREVKNLVAYLTYVDSTSFYPIRNFDLTWYGTVNSNPNKK